MLSDTGVLRDILSRRDPHGYYVIPARPEAWDLVSPLSGRDGVVIVEYGDVILVKTRSRSLASRIARMLASRGLLALEDEI